MAKTLFCVSLTISFLNSIVMRPSGSEVYYWFVKQKAQNMLSEKCARLCRSDYSKYFGGHFITIRLKIAPKKKVLAVSEYF